MRLFPGLSLDLLCGVCVDLPGSLSPSGMCAYSSRHVIYEVCCGDVIPHLNSLDFVSRGVEGGWVV